MVHNGIEYGIMAAYAEGLSILRGANVGKRANNAADAETTPLRDPEHYQYDMNLAADIAEVWRRGAGSPRGFWDLDKMCGPSVGSESCQVCRPRLGFW